MPTWLKVPDWARYLLQTTNFQFVVGTDGKCEFKFERTPIWPNASASAPILPTSSGSRGEEGPRGEPGQSGFLSDLDFGPSRPHGNPDQYSSLPDESMA